MDKRLRAGSNIVETRPIWVLDPFVDQLAGSVRIAHGGTFRRLHHHLHADGLLGDGDVARSEPERRRRGEGHQDAHDYETDDWMVVDHVAHGQRTESREDYGRNEVELLPFLVVRDDLTGFANDEAEGAEGDEAHEDAQRKAEHPRHHHDEGDDARRDTEHHCLEPTPDEVVIGRIERPCGEEDQHRS